MLPRIKPTAPPSSPTDKPTPRGSELFYDPDESRSTVMTARKRLRPRFTLRTLLVLVTAAAALFGWEEYVSWKEARAVRAIEKLYGRVEYGHIGPEWLRRFAGEDYLRRVTSASIYPATHDDLIVVFKELRHLHAVIHLALGQANRRR